MNLINSKKEALIVSENIYHETLEILKKDFFVIFLRKTNLIKNISDHADLFVFFHNNKLFIDKRVIENNLLYYKDENGIVKHFNIYDLNAKIIFCDIVYDKYPLDVFYNIAYTDDYFIFNKKYISKKIYNELKDEVYDFENRIIDIKQGYAKCNILTLKNAIITSDKGIYNICKNKIDTLLITDDFITIDNYDNGFIGGSSLSHKDRVIFNGDITKHPSYEDIKKFLGKYNYKIIFTKDKLKDIGSFIL